MKRASSAMEVMMKRRARLYTVMMMVAFCCVASVTQLNADELRHYSRGQLHKMKQEARTQSNYRRLADYFRQQQLRYSAKAETAEEEWFHSARNVVMPTKFPTRADTAQRLWQYYSYEADKMASLAALYDKKLLAPSK